MTLNTFSGGVNTNFSTELNENFTEVENGYKESQNQSTYSINNGSSSRSSSTTYSDIVTLDTPTSVVDNQKILIEVWFSQISTSSDGNAQIYDATDSVAVTTQAIAFDSVFQYVLRGVVTIASAGNTKSIKLRSNGSGTDGWTIQGLYIKCSFYEG